MKEGIALWALQVGNFLDWSEISNTLIGTIAGAVFAFIGSAKLYQMQKYNKAETSATILHHDIDYALEGIKKAYSEQKRGKTIMKQSHSLLVGNSDFRSLIVEMTSKLNGSDIN